MSRFCLLPSLSSLFSVMQWTWSDQAPCSWKCCRLSLSSLPLLRAFDDLCSFFVLGGGGRSSCYWLKSVVFAHSLFNIVPLCLSGVSACFCAHPSFDMLCSVLKVMIIRPEETDRLLQEAEEAADFCRQQQSVTINPTDES